MLGSFALSTDQDSIVLQPGAQRVVAYAALQNRPVARMLAAGTLWPDTTDRRAAARLRSALWRLGAVDGSLMKVEQGTIALAPCVKVDVHSLQWRARRILSAAEASSSSATLALSVGNLADTTMWASDLLLGWWDDWVIAERERLRITQLAVLERMALLLIQSGRHAQALDVCLRLTAAEPLRETTHRLIIRAHLSQGNRAEAMSHYAGFRDLLWRELRIRPSAQIERLLVEARHVPHRVERHQAVVR